MNSEKLRIAECGLRSGGKKIKKFASPRPVRPLADAANGVAGMQATLMG
jgi:hypothetical protein